jgi:hypothetical protein
MKNANDNLPARSNELEGQLRLKYGVELTDTSLEMPQTLDDAEIIEVAEKVRMLHNAASWWVADLILACQRLFLESKQARSRRREVYDRVLKIWPQYSRETLRTYASIARRVPAKLRSPALSFDHHAHIATLADEDNAAVLQAHYIKAAIEGEATAEQLRLMIADTRKGIAIDKPRRRPMKTVSAAAGGEANPDDPQYHGDEQGDGLPIPREPEPTLLTGGIATLASDAQRACARLREWFTAQARKAKVETWSDERKASVVHDLEPLIKEMHGVADIFTALTAAGEGVQPDAR